MAQQNSLIIDPSNLLLHEQLVEECTAMAKYAFASGLHVPGKVIQILNRFTGKALTCPSAPADGETNQSRDTGTGETGVKSQNPDDIRGLIMVHERLTKIVEPAKPRTILLMEQEQKRKSLFSFLGVVPFIRRMMLAAIVCLVLFITISLSPDINNNPESWDLFKSSGWALLLKELFLLSAAGLGASFTALFRANRYIVEGTFDPKYESSYWIRFSLGFIAGMILATLIPIEESVRADFGKPLLAMLGGFSANLVYRVISRIIDTFEALFRGDNRAMVQAEKAQVKTRATEDEIQNKVKMASNIMKIQQEIDANMKPEEIKQKMGKFLDDMVGLDSHEDVDEKPSQNETAPPSPGKK